MFSEDESVRLPTIPTFGLSILTAHVTPPPLHTHTHTHTARSVDEKSRAATSQRAYLLKAREIIVAVAAAVAMAVVGTAVKAWSGLWRVPWDWGSKGRGGAARRAMVMPGSHSKTQLTYKFDVHRGACCRRTPLCKSAPAPDALSNWACIPITMRLIRPSQSYR